MYRKALKEIWSGVGIRARYGIFLAIGFIICGLLWLTSCSNIQKIVEDIPPDSYIEELTEGVIESYLDVPKGSIDLTPGSIEE